MLWARLTEHCTFASPGIKAALHGGVETTYLAVPGHPVVVQIRDYMQCCSSDTAQMQMRGLSIVWHLFWPIAGASRPKIQTRAPVR